MRKLLMVIFCLVLLVPLVACGESEDYGYAEEVKQKAPFDQYEIKDSKGCEYVVIYERTGGQSGTVAIVPFQNQTKATCE